MILEGIVTTVAEDGRVNIAPMGPQVGATMDRFVLRPFRSAQTYRNLKTCGEGVLHVTDDVLLLAQAALGPVDPPPSLMPASRIRGFVLQNSCRYYEFRVVHLDDPVLRLLPRHLCGDLGGVVDGLAERRQVVLLVLHRWCNPDQ